MQSNFSLSDVDVRQLVDDAQHSNNIDLLRSHIYRFVSLRREMAVAIHNAAQERNDLARVVDTANKVLTEDRSAGLLSLLDRKGLINSHREKLRVQLETNRLLVQQNADFRQRISASQQATAPTKELRDQVAKLTTELSALSIRHEQTILELEQARHEKALNSAIELATTPPPQQDEELLNKVTQQAQDIERLQGELSSARSALNERRQDELAVAVAEQAAETPELEKIQTMFREQVSGYLAENLQLGQALRTNKEALESLTNSLRDVETHLEAAKLANTESSMTIQDLRSQISTAESSIQRLQDELTAQGTTTSQLQAELGRTQKNEAELKEQLGAARSTIADQTSQIEALTTSKGDLAEQVVQLTQQNSEREQKVQTLQLSIQQHIEQIEGIQLQLDDTAANWQRYQSESEKQLAQSDELIGHQRAEMAALEASKGALVQRVGTLTENARHLTQAKLALESALRETSAERRRITSLAKDSALELSLAMQTNRALQSQVNDLQATVSDLNARLQTASKVIHFNAPATRREATMDEDPKHESESLIEHSGPGNSM